MQHVVLYFKHDIQDIIPYCEAVKRIRQVLSDTGTGEYVEDDMAIDGGDAEAVLRGSSADVLYETIFTSPQGTVVHAGSERHTCVRLAGFRQSRNDV